MASLGFLRFIIGPIVRTIGGFRMSLVLTDEQKVSLGIRPTTAAGNPARIDGTPSWQSSDPGIVEVVPVSDGLSAVATAVGPVGVAQVSVSVDADLGAGVRTLTAILDIEVVAAEASTVAITPGTPELK